MAGTTNFRKLHCFVASAFGYDDVDRVYTKLIKPTLRDLHAKVSRIDRVDHNDDIDNKIMELLEAADFCIADLTYARPSVYFEAGFASVTKPVIFIARRDHFRARDNDPLGNQRVHFDLQMKNIISWGASDTVFRKRLRNRVKLVTRPIVKKLATEAKRTSDRESFLALSQNQRIQALEKLAKQAAVGESFSLTGHERWHIPFDLSAAVEGVRTLRDQRITLRVYIEPQFQMARLRNLGYGRAFQPHKNTGEKSDGKRQHVVSILVTPGKLSESTLDRVFPQHTKLAGGVMRATRHEDWSSRKLVNSLVIPIDQVLSLVRFREQIADALKLASAWSRKAVRSAVL